MEYNILFYTSALHFVAGRVIKLGALSCTAGDILSLVRLGYFIIIRWEIYTTMEHTVEFMQVKEHNDY